MTFSVGAVSNQQWRNYGAVLETAPNQAKKMAPFLVICATARQAAW